MLPAPLPDLDALDPEALKALVLAKHSESVRQHEQLTSKAHEIEHLKLVIEKYRRMIFGRKSEKLTRELEQLELRLEELETAQAQEEAAQEAAEAQQPSSSPNGQQRRSARSRRKPLPEDLPREVITHLPAHKCCPDCGGELRKFGEDVSEQLERIPASYKVIRHVRPKFACTAGCDRVEEAPRQHDRSSLACQVRTFWHMCWFPNMVITSPSIASRTSTLARVSNLDRSTLAGWVGAASELLTPLADEIRKHVIGRVQDPCR
jgi:transposase